MAGFFSALIGVIGVSNSTSQTPKGPLSPREELATFQVAPGFKVELVAAEPEVIDPVALAFDEDGRLFVVEMRGYPNGGVGEGQPNLPGRVKRLEDANGDGYFEKATVYVDNLRFPTGVCCWHGGVLVGDAPDLLYCKDTDGDGKADVRRVLYTGFGQKNIQQLLNGLQFHFDNWVHGCNGSNESVIRTDGETGRQGEVAKTGDASRPVPPSLARPVALRGRHFRFKPDVPGSLEPTSGGGQYGLAADDFGQWFTCTNSQHLRHIVLPDHYLRRNPNLPVSSVVNDIPDDVQEHGPAAKVFRISPFEAWRVERTSRRVRDPMGKSFASTELVPGGYITSATGLTVYRGGAFPAEYHGNVFVCDPANNLIHRDVLLPVGPTFFAKRPEEQRDCEFLASTDTWFRPVFLCQGPDGAIYVADFYREIIETPLSLPEDIQKQYNLNSRERGRIWRIRHEDTPVDPAPRKPKLSQASNEELVAQLAHPNAWRRLTAQRLLVERKAVGLAEALVRRAHTGQSPAARIHALWTLEGLGVLEAKHLQPSLRDRAWQVREQALRLAEPYLSKEPMLARIALTLANDPVPRVRFQLALSLGEMKPTPETRDVLRMLLARDGVNPWFETALLSSAAGQAGLLLPDVIGWERASPTLIQRLATLTAAEGKEATLGKTILDLMPTNERPTSRQLRSLDAMLQGLTRGGRSLAEWTKDSPDAGNRLQAFFARLAAMATGESEPLEERVLATRLLGQGSFDKVGLALRKTLAPQAPPEVQMAAVRTLSGMRDAAVAELLLQDWSSYSPAVRREVQEALFARPERLAKLLAALEHGDVQPTHLDPARREFLLKHSKKDVRERAQQLFAGALATERRKVVEQHRGVLDVKGDAVKGKLVFKKNCATCHRLEDEGVEVGADLLAGLNNKTPEALLIDILDPSRDVDPRFLNYVVQSKSGRLFTGVIAAETATSLVLRRAEKAEDTLLRSEIDEIQSTVKSLMPEGLEQQISDAELADLIAYLLGVVSKK
jgi:putative membrane-bound dehydrogenase-like protein